MAESFGELLKNWRGQRRMSQLDLAFAADVSARHISFLETGRSQPSKAMVLKLSESLNVPRSTRNVLLTAAGFAQAYEARNLDEDEMAFVRAAMDWTLDRHNPYPAIAFDRHWQLVRMNDSAAAMLDAMHLGVGDSLLDAFLEGGSFAEALENREEIARHMVSRLRTESAHIGGDEVLDTAIERLAAMLGDDEPAAGDSMPAIIPARYRSNGVLLSFFSTISQFGSTEDIALADIKIELMFPADDFTREALVSQFGAGAMLQ
ncbi:MAG: helix-turn-helix transcriptional regulator [Woeseiaceae bacterium]|nr:helix-turn-helix transcriptional regulator [Woeseiaceae bacterium]